VAVPLKHNDPALHRPGVFRSTTGLLKNPSPSRADVAQDTSRGQEPHGLCGPVAQAFGTPLGAVDSFFQTPSSYADADVHQPAGDPPPIQRSSVEIRIEQAREAKRARSVPLPASPLDSVAKFHTFRSA